MSTLHIANLPEALYTRIQHIARARQRSVNDEVIDLLEQATQLQPEARNQAEILADIRSRRFTYPVGQAAPESVRLLREDRER
jgi:plasmid stability protein